MGQGERTDSDSFSAFLFLLLIRNSVEQCLMIDSVISSV